MSKEEFLPVGRAYYSAAVSDFLLSTDSDVLAGLTKNSEFDVTVPQRDAWRSEIQFLRASLASFAHRGSIYLEFVVPRLGRRIDAVLLLDHVVFVIEFKVGSETFDRYAIEQVWDYALDLKNFHETSHSAQIAPVLVATQAPADTYPGPLNQSFDGVFSPICVGPERLSATLTAVLAACAGRAIASENWECGSYRPTPTIIEAAKSLYSRHTIKELARHDAGAKNLQRTSLAISSVIEDARDQRLKALCLVTGVPGAGKTLVGLDVATKHMDPESELYSVYLSGNGPLVKILCEALTRDRVLREASNGRQVRKGEVRKEVEAFIQNVHHFRDDCLKDPTAPPEHVAIFDEAQRAWNLEQTASFMARKKNHPNFKRSEPEFLLSCLDRHKDWAVVVCLVGGGQEINTGEAGIGEWIEALERSFPDWHVHVSSRLQDDEYRAEKALSRLQQRPNVHFSDDLHLAVSMRSFRAENLSHFVKKVLDLDRAGAAAIHAQLAGRYPIRLTRHLSRAKEWLRHQARGTERYGIVVSSQAQRLKPLAIDVRVATDPVHWFLDDKDDVRSSFYLEDVATEFDVQGLELDWTCVVWDGDFRFAGSAWQHHSFKGAKWQRVRQEERQTYLKNAYRVLLTRARQGMVIVVPEGDPTDPTRASEHYDPTFGYLRSVGIPLLDD